MAKKNRKKTSKKSGKGKGSGGGGKGGTSSGGGPKTDHLRERQAQRKISDEELIQAIENGERSASREDGTVRYSHKGVVHVTTADGVGITAYRLEPLQCICGLDDTKLGDNCDDCQATYVGRDISRIQGVLERLSMGILKANLRGCEYLTHSEDNPDTDRVCIGPPCRVHRNTTDPLAMFLERQTWMAPSFRDVLSHPDVIGYLILAAAGSLLRPIRCANCHGVKSLQRSPNAVDESDTLPWLRQLLDLSEKQDAGQKAKRKEKGIAQPWDDDPCPETKGLNGLQFASNHVGGGVTPLGAAAMAGHFRCALELLRRGASPEVAMSTTYGPTAGGHIPCFLVTKALSPSCAEFRINSSCSQYAEVLQLLAYAGGEDGFLSLSEEKEDECICWLKSAGLWGEIIGSLESQGLKILGSIWDGTCHRFVVKGSCKCTDERCPYGATFVCTIGMRLPEAGNPVLPEEMIYCEPMEDPRVLDFVRRCQSKATKRHPGKHCCQFAHYAAMCDAE